MDTLTVCNRENNLTTPRLYLRPKLYSVPGYNPLQTNATGLGEKIKMFGHQKGLSLRRLAEELDIDPGRLTRCEKGERLPGGAFKRQLVPLFRAP